RVKSPCSCIERAARAYSPLDVGRLGPSAPKKLTPPELGSTGRGLDSFAQGHIVWRPALEWRTAALNEPRPHRAAARLQAHATAFEQVGDGRHGLARIAAVGARGQDQVTESETLAGGLAGFFMALRIWKS